MKRETKTKIFVLTSLVFAIITYVAYLLIKKVNPILVLRTVGVIPIILVFIGIILAEVVRAIRLFFILRILDTRVSFISTIISRFSGNSAGLITPGNLGAEPVRIITLASMNGLPIESLMAAGVLESFYDAVILSIIALIASFYYLPASLLVLLVAIAVLGLWFFGIVGFIYKESFWRRIVLWVSKRVSDKLSNEIYRRYKIFTAFVKTGINLRLHLVSVPLTLLALLVIVFSFMPLSESLALGWKGVLKGLIAYSMSFTMSILPTPGGSGFFEYGLDIVLPKEVVAVWRFTFIMASIIPTLVIMIVAVRMRKMIYKNLKKSLLFMSNNRDYE